MIPKQVFISYSTDDTPVTQEIRDGLEAAGIACWMAPRDIVPGKEYAEQILDALENCAVMVLVVSDTSNVSRFVRNEVERAVSKDKVIIPVRIHDVTLSRTLEFFISSAQWIDVSHLPLTDYVEPLATAIRNHLEAPPSSPQPAAVPHAQGTLPVARTPSEMAANGRNNLPHQLTPFVGRESELAALNHLLAADDVRLITILGPGGIGKTRLSLACAANHLDDARFADGFYFVALGPLSHPQHILLTLAEALSFSFLPGADARTPHQQLLDYLRAKRMLLIFDNFEHLLDGADLVTQILQTAPNVCVLVTSRERLRLPGEHLFPIQGLDQATDHRAGQTISAAVKLFVQSANLLLPGIHFSEEELAVVVVICRLVSGMPLGIELAASWITVLSPAEIMTEIQRSLDFLEAEPRGDRKQHHSMRAVFDSAYQRLQPVEQQAFARLSIFRGGFSREAADKVAGVSLRLLSALADRSLIQHDRELGRYMLHELLRQFAEEKLLDDRQSSDETYERFCSYFAAFLQRHESNLKGREHAHAVAEIDAELENIRIAWQWMITHRRIDFIDHSLETLYVYFNSKVGFEEGAANMEAASDALHMDEPSGPQGILLGKILALQGWMLAALGFFVEGKNAQRSAHALLHRSLEILDKVGVRRGKARALMGLSFIASNDGDYGNAFRLAQEALAIFTQEHDSWNMAHALGELAHYSYQSGQYGPSLDFARQAIAISEESGDLHSLSSSLFYLVDTLRAAGNYEEARLEGQKCLTVSKATGDKRSTAFALQHLGEVAWHVGEYGSASEYAKASLALCQELGLTRVIDTARVLRGNISCSLGDYAQARSYFYPVLKSHLQANTLSSYWTAADALLGMATVLAQEQKILPAVEVLIHVLHHPVAHMEIVVRAARLHGELAAKSPKAGELTARPLEVVVAEWLNE